MCFSPDSKMLAITREGQQRMIELYEVPGGKRLQAFSPGEQKMSQPLTLAGGALLFSPDGKMLAAFAGKNTLGLWDATTGLSVGQFRLPTLTPRPEVNAVPGGAHAVRMEMTSAAFSPDGRRLALEMPDGTTALYELATEKRLRTFGKPRNAPLRKARQDAPSRDEPGSCFAFSRDGTLLARGGFDCLVHVWDVETGRELAVFQGHAEAVTSLAFAPDGRTLASASADGTALVWDVSKLKR
jgi:WD40 repeat protein